MFELPVVPTAVTRRPLGDVDDPRMSPPVFHLRSTDGADEVLKFELRELVVIERRDTAPAVDIVAWAVLIDVTAALGATQQRGRTGGPPDIAVERRCARLRTRQPESGLLRIGPQRLDDPDRDDTEPSNHNE